MPDKSPRIESVVFVSPQMEARGTNEYAVNMAAELKRRGLSVAVFCAPGPMLNLLRKRDVRAETFEGLAKARLHRAERKRFFELLAELDPQMLHVQTARLAQMLVELRDEITVPIVLTVHGVPAKPRAFRAVAAGVRGIVATSQDVRQDLVNRCKVDKDKIAYIPNGVDLDGLDFRELKPIFTAKVPVVGSVGPVEEARGHELFVRAAARLINAGQKIQFLVVGEGSEVPQLRRLSRELGLDCCLTFVGDFWSYEDVLEALDVVVQTSQVDVSGFSILDAMAHGRPVIAFNTGTACEIIDDGKTGFLVTREGFDQLAQAIGTLAENPDKARRMGEAARAKVTEKFNVRSVAERTLHFYHDLLTD